MTRARTHRLARVVRLRGARGLAREQAEGPEQDLRGAGARGQRRERGSTRLAVQIREATTDLKRADQGEAPEHSDVDA